jgi:hypothetical protein
VFPEVVHVLLSKTSTRNCTGSDFLTIGWSWDRSFNRKSAWKDAVLGISGTVDWIRPISWVFCTPQRDSVYATRVSIAEHSSQEMARFIKMRTLFSGGHFVGGGDWRICE